MSQREREKKAHDLFKRFDGNPVLGPADWPYPANAVFNPGAAEVDGQIRLASENLILPIISFLSPVPT